MPTVGRIRRGSVASDFVRIRRVNIVFGIEYTQKSKKLAEASFFNVAGVRGFEPRNAGIRIRCLTAWRYPNKLVFEFAERIRHIQNLVATTGFEPVTPSL